MAQGRHRLSVQVTAADVEALDALLEKLATEALSTNLKRSDVIRVALRLGLEQLTADPSRVYTTPPPGRVADLKPKPKSRRRS